VKYSNDNSNKAKNEIGLNEGIFFYISNAVITVTLVKMLNEWWDQWRLT